MSNETLPTILIADDDRDLVKALSSRLMHLGYRVTISHDALSALVLAKHDPPDLVLMDIKMPGGNGVCVLEMLRSDAQWCELPVIVVSGVATPEMIQRVRSLNGHFVSKTTDMWQRIQNLVQSHLGKQPLSVPAS